MVAAIRPLGLIPAAALGVGAAGAGLLAGINPALAVALALAAAFMLIALADLYAGLVLFVLLTAAAEIPGLVAGGVTISKFAGVMLLISWLATLTLRREAKAAFPSVHPAATVVLGLFLSWLAISQVWAEDPDRSIDVLFRLGLNVVLFLIVFTAVRTPQQMLGVLAAFVAGACLDALYGLVNPVDVANEARLVGSVSKPGELASALVAGLVLSLGLAAALKRMPLARLAVFAAAILCAVGVFLTGSRGGLIALAVALAAFIVVGGRWRGRMLAFAAVVAVAGVSFFSYAASSDLKDRVYTLGTGSGRVDLWSVGWQMVEDNPIGGVGIGNFPVTSVHYVLQPGLVTEDFAIDAPQVTHNTYLELWAETGVVGVGLFVFIVGFCLRSVLRAAHEFARQGNLSMEMVSRALFVAMVGFLAGAFFTSRQYEKDLWLLLALGVAMLGVARAQAEARASAEELHAPDEKAGDPATLGAAGMAS